LSVALEGKCKICSEESKADVAHIPQPFPGKLCYDLLYAYNICNT